MNIAEPSDPRPRRRRTWWLSLLLSLLVFGGGAVAGGAVTALVIYRGLQQAIHHPRERPAEAARALRRQLDLSPAEHDAVLHAITRRHEHVLELRRTMQPAMDAELDALRAEVAQIVGPNRQAQWFTIFDRFRSRWLPPPPPAEPEEE